MTAGTYKERDAERVIILTSSDAGVTWEPDETGGVGGGAPAAHAASHADGGTDEVSLDGSQITSGTVADAQIASTIARDSEVTAAVAAEATARDAAIAAHAAAGDPHPVYLTAAEGNAAYQPLDSDLTTIAGLTATTDNFIVSVASAWASRTPTQVKATLAITESDVASLVADLAAKQPLDSDLTTIAGLTATTDNFMVATASAWASRTPTQARSQLGLGTIATQDANNVTITGGSITAITDLVVADGGTGRSTLTNHGVLVGAGTTAITQTAAGTSGEALVSGGASADPAFGAMCDVQVYAVADSPATWTKPANCKFVEVVLMGGGGGGGAGEKRASGTAAGGGSGGGAGGIARTLIQASALSATETVTIGGGGAGAAATASTGNGAAGTAGGDTKMTIAAGGGVRLFAGGGLAGQGGTGGTYGAPLATTGLGTSLESAQNHAGGVGGDGVGGAAAGAGSAPVWDLSGGGGGGGGGTTGAAIQASGAGGRSSQGTNTGGTGSAGGAGGGAGVNGGNGVAFSTNLLWGGGGGGGGGGRQSGNATGGTGGNGALHGAGGGGGGNGSGTGNGGGGGSGADGFALVVSFR